MSPRVAVGVTVGPWSRRNEYRIQHFADRDDITEHELRQCEQANASGRPPVVFVHGLWLLPSSWDRWAALFEETAMWR
jgi:pimeloyl-ACP methyl ester carboxylesterase